MKTLDNPLTSPSFLGYRIDPADGSLFWRVCSWCPGKEEVEEEAARLKVKVTHTCCLVHAKKFLEAVKL